MSEIHPFGNFVPKNTKYLFLGSFTGKVENASYDWFYSNKRNQFWQIVEKVYEVTLDTKIKKQDLFTTLKMAITDIILSCDRKSNSNLDMNLTDMVFNASAIVDIINGNKISSIFFSSRFAEKLFKKNFKEIINKHPHINLITLPSPSPRYAAMSKQEKINRYKVLLPRLR